MTAMQKPATLRRRVKEIANRTGLAVTSALAVPVAMSTTESSAPIRFLGLDSSWVTLLDSAEPSKSGNMDKSRIVIAGKTKDKRAQVTSGGGTSGGGGGKVMAW